ncbi:MAG: hypothetical protein ACP5M4_15240, partial [Acidobacteriaceae bacterium]
MGDKQIRIGQLIAPFGPGSIYVDRRGTPHVVCGLDHWFERWDPARGWVHCDHPDEFERGEPRLSAILRVNRFRIPPDHRHVKPGGQPPPNAGLNVPAHRFPRWHRNTLTGEMRMFSFATERVERPKDGGRWQPVRFVSVCAGGHLCEFPWKQWIGCNCPGDEKLKLTDLGGADLSSIRVRCDSCPAGSPGRKGKSLAGTTGRPDATGGEESAFQKAGIGCPGERPWLGDGADEKECPYPLVGALIHQTNLYFPRTISAITIPDLRPLSPEVAKLRGKVERLPTLGSAKLAWELGRRPGAVGLLREELRDAGIQFRDEHLEEVLVGLFDRGAVAPPTDAAPPAESEPEILAFRRAEFSVLRDEIEAPLESPNLRVVRTSVPESLSPWISRVRIVEKLKEARVFFGFDRLDPNSHPLTDMPDTAMRQLFRDPPNEPEQRWLPMVEVFGEGIYIEID